jgi:hypothetical protein
VQAADRRTTLLSAGQARQPSILAVGSTEKGFQGPEGHRRAAAHRIEAYPAIDCLTQKRQLGRKTRFCPHKELLRSVRDFARKEWPPSGAVWLT